MFFKSNKIYHIGKKQDYIADGGLARDNAIYQNLKKHSYLIPIKKNKLSNIIRILFFLTISKNNKIFMHYPAIGIPVSDRFHFLKYLRKIYIKIFLYSQTRNSFYIDISDLPLEQAVDLELPSPIWLKEIEPHIFNNRAHYFFASHSMRDYAIDKYHLDKFRTTVWINGGYNVCKQNIPIIIDTEKINYVYAGTLNKGRQIEKMLSIFIDKPDRNLILMGINGEWLNNIKLPSNVKYLGALEEKKAHYIVSLCDIGLIPYDNNRAYYNIAYPTKLSFYITAGIPYLSTKVNEVKTINEKYNIGYIADINKWEYLISHITKNDIKKKKEIITHKKSTFLWSNIINIKDLYKDVNHEVL